MVDDALTTDARSRFPARIELLVLLGLLVIAAVTRLPGLDVRGRWDADQGHDMLALLGLVARGEVPLLGPMTSIGTFHHGAAYYWLLAPAAAVSGADPVAVTAWIAMVGVGAVLATWWLARIVGGPVAGTVAGLLAAISPAGIDESTFIWNPNIVPLFAALAFGGAIRARQTGRTRWWLVAGLGAMMTMQGHVLGVVVIVPLAWAWTAEAIRRRRAGAATRPMILAGVGSLAIVAAGFLPLLVHELGHDFAETRGILAYVAGGGREASAALPTRVALVGLRSVTWPVAGLITERTIASMAAAIIVLVLMGVAVARRAPGEGRRATVGAGEAPNGPAVDVPAARWLAGSLAWSVAALAIFAPSLATVTPGLPNDHYHAFLDPVVLALTGVGVGRLWHGLSGSRARRPVGRIVAGAALAVLVVVAVTAWPPATADDGGWRGVDEVAARVEEAAAGRPIALDGIPPFKSADALRFPLERRGVAIVPEASAPGVVVVVCDPLFDEVVGTMCGGPAEDAWLSQDGRRELRLADRYDAGPRRVVSVYEVPGR